MRIYPLVLGAAILNLVLFIIFIAGRIYPPPLMLLHIVSLIFLWGLVFVKIKLHELLAKNWQEVLIIFVLISVSLWVRLYKVDQITPGMYGDEVTVAHKSLDLLKLKDWPPFDGVYSHPTPLMYMTAASIQEFGHTITAVRLPSIIFGALAVGAFYILLRLFFSIGISALGSLLMSFQYTDVVLSRLAYEPPASLFFQTLTAIFLVLFSRTKDKIYLIGISLSLGAGLYTYLNFRPFAAVVLLLTIILIVRGSKKNLYEHLLILASSFFASIAALFSYLIIDTVGFWGRVNDISIFARHYSPVEFTKELFGNIWRTAAVPFIGDPNPGKNPSGLTLFDPLTIILAISGLVFLFKKSRTLFWGAIIMLVPPFLSDIFSTEVIPEAHYYGLGHPNALRVSGFIWIVLVLAVFGLNWVYLAFKKHNVQKVLVGLGLFIIIICWWNFRLYFSQEEINPGMYVYNFVVNHEDVLQMIDYLNGSSSSKISMSRVMTDYEHVPFFMDPAKKVYAFDPVSASAILSQDKKSDTIAIDITKTTLPIINQAAQDDVIKNNYNVKVISDPINQPLIIIFQKKPR